MISSACGGDMMRTGRAAVFLTVENMEATSGGEAASSGAFLLSDVQPVFNDTLTATIRSNEKNQNVDSLLTIISAVTLTRYHVDFRRTDGRNTPGVDVPFGFDGGLGVTIQPGGTAAVSISLVRHQAKLEPPLKNLAGGGGQVFISTIAEVTFYGRDQNGNEVAVTGRIDVQFADFADQ